MLENFFNKINQEVDAKRTETPSSMAPTLKKTVELKPEDLEPVVEGPSEKAPTIKVLSSEELKPVVGPSEKAPTLVKPSVAEQVETLVTDKTLEQKKEDSAAKAPTVRTAESMELKASEAQTFKTGETIAREEAAKEAAEQQYQEKVAQEKVTLRKMAEGYMEYDAIHNRITEWLKTLDEMLATPQPMEELIKLKTEALKVKEKVEGQLDLEQYGIAKAEPNATPFSVEVPAEWPQVEARLNEIKESINAGHTIRTPEAIPTVREEPKIDLAA
ncbi:MAG: hypothetical protein PHC70_00235 [Patescibacteria group bacterium]|nr:hypothetical protein [Patescibacteria group bacterium]